MLCFMVPNPVVPARSLNDRNFPWQRAVGGETRGQTKMRERERQTDRHSQEDLGGGLGSRKHCGV